jgi:hypothetical protein
MVTETDFVRRMHQDSGHFPNAETWVVPSPLDDRVSSRHIKLKGVKVPRGQVSIGASTPPA